MKLEILQAKSLHEQTSVLKISRKSTEKWLRKMRVLPRKIIITRAVLVAKQRVGLPSDLLISKCNGFRVISKGKFQGKDSSIKTAPRRDKTKSA